MESDEEFCEEYKNEEEENKDRVKRKREDVEEEEEPCKKRRKQNRRRKRQREDPESGKPKAKRPRRERTIFIEEHILNIDDTNQVLPRVDESTGDPLDIDLIEPESLWKSNFDVPGLPKPPFSQIVNAQSNSGKTNYLLNLLQPIRYGSYFSEIHVFSETILADPKWDHLIKNFPWLEKLKFYEGWDKKAFMKLYEEQKEKVEKDGQNDKNAILVILDDVAGELFNRGGKPTVVQHAFMRFRHINGSIIVTSQEYMMLPKTVRVNTNSLVLFELNNRKEKKTVSEEHGNGLDQHEFDDLLKQIWRDKFAFLFIDYKRPVTSRFRKNLNAVMIHPENYESSEEEMEN